MQRCETARGKTEINIFPIEILNSTSRPNLLFLELKHSFNHQIKEEHSYKSWLLTIFGEKKQRVNERSAKSFSTEFHMHYPDQYVYVCFSCFTLILMFSIRYGRLL